MRYIENLKSEIRSIVRGCAFKEPRFSVAEDYLDYISISKERQITRPKQIQHVCF